MSTMWTNDHKCGDPGCNGSWPEAVATLTILALVGLAFWWLT